MVEIRKDSYEVSVEQVIRVQVFDKNLEIGYGYMYFNGDSCRIGQIFNLVTNEELPSGMYDIQPVGDWHFIVTRKNDVNRH